MVHKPKPPAVVKGVTVILSRGDKVLVNERDNNPRIPHPGQFAFFSGVHGDGEPGDTLYDTAWDVLTRVFGWKHAQQEIHYIGKSVQVAGYFYGELSLMEMPELLPGEGARIHLFSADELEAKIAEFGVGNQPGQFVPLVEKRLRVIQDLLRGTLRPNRRLITS